MNQQSISRTAYLPLKRIMFPILLYETHLLGSWQVAKGCVLIKIKFH